MWLTKQILYCQQDVILLQMGAAFILLFQDQSGAQCQQYESLYDTAA